MNAVNSKTRTCARCGAFLTNYSKVKVRGEECKTCRKISRVEVAKQRRNATIVGVMVVFLPLLTTEALGYWRTGNTHRAYFLGIVVLTILISVRLSKRGGLSWLFDPNSKDPN